MRLFVERARAVQPDFELDERTTAAVVGICGAVDGMPLALELAACRVRALAPEEILERLGQGLVLLASGNRPAPAIHRTMRAAVEWSYGLLSEQERELFDRLSVFFGGWTVEAAEVVCAGEGIDPAEVLDLLSSLIDKSLVVSEAHRGRSRQRLLEPLRQYAAERLAARGHQPAAHLRDRHAAFFLSRARRSFAPSFEASAAELEAAASQHPGWLDRLEHEHDNVRGALNWLLDNRRVEEAQRLGAAFWRFWSIRGHLSEGETWMRRIIDLPHGDVSTRIRVLLGAGVLAFTKLRTGSGSPSQDCG